MGRRPKPGPNQESVWDYPRPPAVEPVEVRVRVVFAGVTVADTTRALRVLETSHPPTYYIPPEDVRLEHVTPEGRTTHCEWKGQAEYVSLDVDGQRATHAAWRYPSPLSAFAALKDHLAFYPSRVDACYVGDEQATAQEGDFYGGWITSNIVGPFKGGPGTWGW